MTCLSCKRAPSKSRTVTRIKLPSGAVAAMCDECAGDRFRVAEAERRIPRGDA